jgi:hypothetical protein
VQVHASVQEKERTKSASPPQTAPSKGVARTADFPRVPEDPEKPLRKLR